MIHDFTSENIQEISVVLGSKVKPIGQDLFRLELKNERTGHKLALEIHLSMEVHGKNINMVSVYSGATFMQLHNVTQFVASDLLGQVTFFGKSDNRTTGIIVDKESGCSLYANVDDKLLQGDFTKLPEDLMMCSVALSLTDSPDLADFSFEDDEPK
jgi:hypothetical protein